jgi:hypothetical protein
VANTLAYYDTARITAIKSFIVQAPDQQKLSYLNCKKLKTLNNPTNFFIFIYFYLFFSPCQCSPLWSHLCVM